MKYICLLIVVPYVLGAIELQRLDSFGSDDFSKLQNNLILYVTENCSVCAQQISVLKSCIPNNKVNALLEGTNEEKMRFYVRRKKFPFKTYFLLDQLKQSLDLKQSPQLLTIKSNKVSGRLVGLQSCEDIKKIYRL